MNFAIKTANICKNYGSFSLKNVSLEIPRGYITGLIGSNGAGKSTLIKCITGAALADSGSTELGEGITKERLGLVFDECPFPQHFTCRRLSVLFGKMFSGWDGDRFLSLLEKYSIDPERKVKQLSRGMGMKLQVAVALSHPTDLLLLDEPTAGMDPASRDEFLDSLRDYMQDESHSILISSHITSDLEKVADYVAFLKGGELLLFSEKDSIEESYGLLKTGKSECPVDRELVACSRSSESNTVYLINDKQGIREAYPELVVDDATLEDIMIMFARGDCE